MENTEDKDPKRDLEEFDSNELLKLDLGKGIYDIFDKIDEMDLVTSDVAVQDAAFYRGQISKARGFASTIRREISLILKAKTKAQARLTSRQTRWEILMDEKLEKDAHVKSGVSIDERKARAANEMVQLKNAIASSKNEVEALKNVKLALDNTLRDFNAQASDFKEQAKLINETLGPIGRQLPPNGNSVNESNFNNSVDAIEQKYAMEVEDVAVESESVEELPGYTPSFSFGSEEESTEEVEESEQEVEVIENVQEEPEEVDSNVDALASQMLSAFGNASSAATGKEVSVQTYDAYDADEVGESTVPGENPEPSFGAVSEEETVLGEKTVGETGMGFSLGGLSDTTKENKESEDTSKASDSESEGSPQNVTSSSTIQETPLEIKEETEPSLEVENDVDLSGLSLGLSLGADTLEEVKDNGSSDEPSPTLKQEEPQPEKAEEAVATEEEGDYSIMPDFGLDEASVTKSKVTKHFNTAETTPVAEEPSEEKVSEPVKEQQEPKVEPKVEPKEEDGNIDSLLEELGVL